MKKRTTDYGSFCFGKKCPEFIEWEVEGQYCESCKLIGQSYIVDEYPKNCLFLKEIEKL